MTITVQTPRTGPTAGDGATVAFSYSFLVDIEAELVVIIADTNGEEATQTLGVDYTVAGVGVNAGGTVTFSTAPLSTDTVTITRGTALKQSVDLENRGAVVPEVVETSLDELTKITQDQQEQLSRTLRLPVSDGVAANPFVSAENRKGKVLQGNTVTGLLEFTDATVSSVSDIPVVADIADLPNLTGLPNAAAVRAHTNEADGGGGLLFRDAASADAIDDAFTFAAPAGGGRFKRPRGASLKASEVGLVDSLVTDQSVRLQEAIVIAMAESLTLEIDVKDIDCAGAEIWFNYEGTFDGATRTPIFQMRGAMRRKSRINNGFFTFGKEYAYVLAGDVVDTGDPITGQKIYTHDTDASAGWVLENVHLTGMSRFINIEGAMALDKVNFFAASMTNFYKTVPTNWGANMAEVPTTFGGGAGTAVPYTDLTHLVECLQCNHPSFLQCNVQNGNNQTNIAGDGIGGMSFAASGNATVIGGVNTNNRENFYFGSHPIYAGAVNQVANVIGPHTEDTVESVIVAKHVRHGYFNTHSRPSGKWNTTSPAVLVDTASAATQASGLHFDMYIEGNDNATGTCFQIDDGDNIKIGGRIKEFGTGIKIGSGASRVTDVGVIFEDVGVETEIVDGMTSQHNPAFPEKLSPLALVRTRRALTDDWSGRTLDTNKWVVRSGVHGSVVPFAIADGILTGTTGAQSPTTVADNAIMVASGLNFQADAGQINYGCNIDGDTSALAAFCGLTDQDATLEIPASIAASDVFTPVATDFVGLLYDSRADSDFWWAVARNAGGTMQTVVTTATQTGATAPRNMRVEVDAAGDARFWIAGVEVATITAAVDPTVLLSGQVSAMPTSAVARVVDVRYLGVEQER